MTDNGFVVTNSIQHDARTRATMKLVKLHPPDVVCACVRLLESGDVRRVSNTPSDVRATTPFCGACRDAKCGWESDNTTPCRVTGEIQGDDRYPLESV